ncbi:glycolipid anchored surface protein [Durotheca rogersii]|uniref:glycolipid anchored surface protein n=1 Tax=Durotheca rogersii TaxID=419775 RepID=UPI00221F9807|nr:glycolipid anchored surface protein [Durotheca rogersii]KAI5864458.1 glycolipid anchored surface protein [Durotheca rogersii]
MALVAPITVGGRYFWRGNERFLVNGVLYQKYVDPAEHGDMGMEMPADPLADDSLEDLRKSIPLFKELGLNTIFVPYIDSSKNHDAAMTMLAEAGIYVFANLSSPDCGANRAALFKPYTADLLERYLRAVDSIAHYPNTLGLSVAHGAIGDFSCVNAAPVIRAIVRDVKRYLTLRTSSAMGAGEWGQRLQRGATPVGISCSDALSLLKVQYDYFCAGSSDEAADFFAFNNFSWAGKSNLWDSGYNRLIKMFSGSPVPVFISGYGAYLGLRRLFHETRAIYSPPMVDVFSGGIVYEFINHHNSGYGLVKRGSRSAQNNTCPWSKRREFSYLKKNLAMFFMQAPPTVLGNEVPSGTTTNDNFSASTGLSAGTSRPKMPKPSPSWPVKRPVPPCPIDWSIINAHVESDSEWVDVKEEILSMAVDDVIDSVWDQLYIDDSNLN